MKKIFLFCMIALLSCTKVGKSVTVKGRFYNPLTGEGIEGVKLILHRNKTFSYEAGVKIYKEAYTDADGNYEVSALSTHNNISFSVKQFPGDYYWIGWVEGGKVLPQSELQIKIGKKKKADYQAVPKANYQLKMINMNCSGGTDTLIFKVTDQFNTAVNKNHIHAGCGEVNTSTKFPMGNLNLYYEVIRNGIKEIHEEDFFIQPNQDNIHLVHY